MDGLIERLKARYALPEGYHDDADYGCNENDPESLMMCLMDSATEGANIMRCLAVNDYTVVPDATLDEAADRIIALEKENERLRATRP